MTRAASINATHLVSSSSSACWMLSDSCLLLQCVTSLLSLETRRCSSCLLSCSSSSCSFSTSHSCRTELRLLLIACLHWQPHQRDTCHRRSNHIIAINTLEIRFSRLPVLVRKRTLTLTSSSSCFFSSSSWDWSRVLERLSWMALPSASSICRPTSALSADRTHNNTDYRHTGGHSRRAFARFCGDRQKNRTTM